MAKFDLEDKMTPEVFILDFAALINPPTKGRKITTSLVLKEVLNEVEKSIVQARVESGDIEIMDPKSDFLQEASEAAIRTGDFPVLSNPDLSLIAIALELKYKGLSPMILTNDFAIQNVCKFLKIRVKPVGSVGIREQIVWIRICPVCRKKYPMDYHRDTCPECGSKLTRKATTKLILRKDNS